MPRIEGRLGLTGKTVPPKGLEIRFQRMVRPTLPCVSVAPMTATFFGAKIASSGLASNLRTSAARSKPENAGVDVGIMGKLLTIYISITTEPFHYTLGKMV